ncbi:DUF4365 domain-containing protein [Adhaeribacter sp. BT258]|uniref:DUF4365 domain-containing protein n=1 Tax=Adhaeribacter terrigena TaxID=2793070 RepID=A0ABS1BXD1_9BACT|nr:DUF4365 domain-containing protein [Adhaeribacter terrigena]MBK0401802.1 DUF4365 domain-containing protein [Adhaeribacter terrigena]
MPKFVNNTHVTGERGVLAFSTYCNKHNPYIIFREVTKNDFGIDGEVEIVRTNEEGKKEATGEVLKVQIKSTASDKGYIRRETDEEIEFQAKKEDIEYWSKYSLDVLLVLYDDRNEKLYCRKIEKVDLAKVKLKNSQPIIFNKNENLLEVADNKFVLKFSHKFKQRVNFDADELLLSNMLHFKAHPRVVYKFDSKFTTKRRIFEELEQDEAPIFVLNSNSILTFFDESELSEGFKSKILASDVKETVYYNDILEDRALRNNYIELINEYVRKHLYSKRLKFNKDYKRYYFAKPSEADSREISYRSRKMNRSTPRTVVNKYTYGKDTFYRHAALGIEYHFIEDKLYFVMNPKYLFTHDGNDTLSPDKITKYTNFLTAREFNQQILNTVHFFFDYLSNVEDGISLWDYNKHKILLSKYISFFVKFGIPLDTRKDRGRKNENRNGLKQAELF